MKNWFLVLFSIVFFTGYSAINASARADAAETVKSPSGQFASETHFEPGKGVLITEAANITAAVLSVDKQDRSIVVKAPDGNAIKIELTEDVKNFDQIHPGDKLVLELYTALAMQLAKPGEEFTDTASNVVAIAQPGQKPKLVTVDIVEVLAKITGINKDAREVTVTGPLGNSVTLQVPEKIKKFDELKVGDEVNARYVEAFAASVQTVD
jgi:hypothetical protein